MDIFKSVQGIRDAVNRARAAGKRVGFVPTMGNLHEGHLQLVRVARQQCDLVVASIFVNPLQFGVNEDLDAYPRTFAEDVAKLEAAGCDCLLYPSVDEVYPNGMALQTRVVVPTMTDVLCGTSRPTHFDGVTTVVAKLFNMVQPDMAVFGLKDFQQIAVIRRMVEDLCMPVDIVPAPIVRETDGLAMSSRNGNLIAEERPQVICLYESLRWIEAEVKSGRRDFVALETEAAERIKSVGFNVDYIDIRNPRTLASATDADSEFVVLAAMYATGARLIDNLQFSV